MDIRAKIDGSKVAQQIAYSFLVGYGLAILPLLVPAVADFGQFMMAVLNRLWWYRFFSAGMTGALSFAFGQYLPSVFDTNRSSPPKTIQFTQS